MKVGLRYQLTDEWQLIANADWEEWSQFSDNYLFVEGGVLDPKAALDRKWKDTWHAGIGASDSKESSTPILSCFSGVPSVMSSDAKWGVGLKLYHGCGFIKPYLRKELL